MPVYTEQMKTISEALRRAGLKRYEFSIERPRIYIGTFDNKQEYEHGDIEITLKCNLDRAISLTNKFVARGLHVTHIINPNGEVIDIQLSIDKPAGLEVISIAEQKSLKIP